MEIIKTKCLSNVPRHNGFIFFKENCQGRQERSVEEEIFGQHAEDDRSWKVCALKEWQRSRIPNCNTKAWPLGEEVYMNNLQNKIKIQPTVLTLQANQCFQFFYTHPQNIEKPFFYDLMFANY